MATIKERVIKRLNKGFGFDIPLDAHWHTHERAFRDCGEMMEGTEGQKVVYEEVLKRFKAQKGEEV